MAQNDASDGDVAQSGKSTSDTLHLADWLESQKERAEERIADERVGEEKTLRWKGERDCISAIQSYVEMGVFESQCGTERIDELDEMTLSEYPYQVELRVSILANPDNGPKEWAENVEMVVEDALSSVPCTVDSAVLKRPIDTDTDRSGGNDD